MTDGGMSRGGNIRERLRFQQEAWASAFVIAEPEMYPNFFASFPHIPRRVGIAPPGSISYEHPADKPPRSSNHCSTKSNGCRPASEI